MRTVTTGVRHGRIKAKHDRMKDDVKKKTDVRYGRIKIDADGPRLGETQTDADGRGRERTYAGQKRQ